MALTLHGTVADNTVVLSRQNAKPLIINGDMKVFQRGTSVTSVTSNGCKIADRMYFEHGSLGTWTIAQSTDVPTGQGFVKSQKYDCTTADASPASGDYLLPIEYHFEGVDLQLLKKGTSSAEPITVAVWLKSNLTGNFNMEIWDRQNDRQIHAVCNIGSANTWTKFVKTFPGDTTGALTADSAHRFSIGIWGDSGSNFRGGTVSTAWGANVAANRCEGNVNLGNNTANELLVCGLQMEIGSFDANSIPPFQHESFGDSLRRCRRYFQKYTQPPLIGSANATNTVARASIGLFPVQMRAAPTAVQSGTFNWFYSNGHQPTSTALAASYTDIDTAEFDITMGQNGMTATHPCSVLQNGSGFLSFEAEI